MLLAATGKLTGGRLGDTLSGFGIAHVVLGILDALRNNYK